MSAKSKEHRKLGKELKHARAEHDQFLKQVEKARVKFEKRTQKLQALETRIAELESEYYEPELERLGQADADDKSLRHARLIFNPKSGGLAKGTLDLRTIVGALRAHGIVADIGVKTSGKAARELAKEAADKGEDLVIVAAGDGTLEDVASQLLGTQTALGIIPIGTMNNLARALGVPLDLENACALLGMGVTRPIDLGHVLAHEKPDVEYFLETAGAGLSAIVIPAGQAAEKGRWTEIPDAIRKLFEARPSLVTVQLDHGDIIQANSQVVTVSNAPLMGSNVLIAPEAKMDDGLLDIAVYDDLSKTELLSYFMAASGGQRAENPKVKFYRAKHVRIESQEPVAAHADKDTVAPQRVLEKKEGATHDTANASERESAVESGSNGSVQPRYVLEVQVVPGALRMVVGNGIGLSLPVKAAPAVPPLSGPPPQENQNGAEHQ
jgi:diacylglycerol kinase (ATP)